VRTGIALALANGSIAGAAGIAADRWGKGSTTARELGAFLMTKAGEVPGAGTGSGQGGSQLASASAEGDDYVQFVRPRMIVGKLALRLIPPRVPFAIETAGATGFFVGEGLARPASKMAFTRASLMPATISSFAIFSNELLRLVSTKSELAIRADLVAATVEACDAAFVSESAGAAGQPAGILNASIDIASTGVLANDVENAIDSFGGRLDTASWLANPRLGAQIGLRTGAGGASNDCGARGGTLAGLPLITSEALTDTSDGADLVLVDAAGIALSEDGASIRASQTAMVEASSVPAGDTQTPTAANAVAVSLFQEESSSLIANLFMRWLVCRAGSVVRIEGCNYLS
jgi:hypothetical protein